MSNNVKYVIAVVLLFSTSAFAAIDDPNLSFQERVDDVVSAMTLDEKVSLLNLDWPAIENLGVEHFKFWHEALHGVCNIFWTDDGQSATQFPINMGLAATWDPNLIEEITTAISEEARIKSGNRGLSIFTPMINLTRDPRWGRCSEGYGEDPYLTSRMGVAYVKGIQGDDPKYLRNIATLKHYAVHGGPEEGRLSFDADGVGERELREYYLPPFEACVKEAKAAAVMSAYNAVNGVPVSINEYLLTTILRQEWGFDGYVVNDVGAYDFVISQHQYAPAKNCAIYAIEAGLDIATNNSWAADLKDSVLDETLDVAYVDQAVKRALLQQFRLGMYDPDSMVPYANIDPTKLNCQAHQDLALKAAQESIVLLKNENDLLPLSKSSSIAVIGPHGNHVELGAYSGTPPYTVTPYQGIQDVIGLSNVEYVQGCAISETVSDPAPSFSDAIAAANRNDVVIMFVGIDGTIEGEGNDRPSIALPGDQPALIQAVVGTGKPVVLVMNSGSCLTDPYSVSNVPAILQAWYGGQEYGNAIADVVFGDYNPGGKLPVTFYASDSQLPSITDYATMADRTYLYFTGAPNWAFGHGLSYTTFSYSNLSITPTTVNDPNLNVQVSVDVTNTGTRFGDEVIQLYLKDMSASVTRPIHQLQGFKRIALEPSETKTVTFTLMPEKFSLVNDIGTRLIEPGDFQIRVGGNQTDVLTGTVTINDGLVISTALPKPPDPERITEETEIAESPIDMVQAESFSSQNGIGTESCSDLGGGLNIGFIENGDYAIYNNVDFRTGAAGIKFRVASAWSPGIIEVRLDSPAGTLLGTCSVPVTGGWQEWETKDCTIAETSGLNNICLVFTGGASYLFNVNWFRPVIPLPAPWQFNDVGRPEPAGAAVYDPSDDDFTVYGGGADIHGTTDEFAFVNQSITGDTSISARVISQTNTNIWAKSGVMFRETTDGMSKNVALLVTPGGDLILQWRDITSDVTSSAWLGYIDFPVYIKLEKVGTTYNAYKSSDGIDWGAVLWSHTSNMNSALAGLCVTSHDETITSTVEFDSVIVGCNIMDLNNDCDVNMLDFAILSQDWLTGYDLNDLANMALNWLD
ncbi:MAG: glycoside hydrolase family 3 protein [Planctomycetota bacterium]|jgi:beta-glucosidase